MKRIGWVILSIEENEVRTPEIFESKQEANSSELMSYSVSKYRYKIVQVYIDPKDLRAKKPGHKS